MSRFIRIPNQDEGVVHIINSDDVTEALLDMTTIYITMRKEKQVIIEFETPEEGQDFIDKNFILFNS